MQIDTNHGETRGYLNGSGSPIRREENGLYSVRFDPFNDWPDRLDIRIESIRMIHDDAFSFSFDLPKEDGGDEVRLDRLIERKANTAIYLEELHYSERGTTVKLRYEPEEKKEFPYKVLDGTTPFPHDLF